MKSQQNEEQNDDQIINELLELQEKTIKLLEQLCPECRSGFAHDFAQDLIIYGTDNCYEMLGMTEAIKSDILGLIKEDKKGIEFNQLLEQKGKLN